MSLVYKLLSAMSPVYVAFEEMFLVYQLLSAMSPVCAASVEMFLVYLAMNLIGMFLMGICGVPSAMILGDYMQ